MEIDLDEYNKGLLETKKDFNITTNFDLNGLKIEAITIKDNNVDKVMDAYEVQLKKDGWELVEKYGYYFRKGEKGLKIDNVPIDQDQLTFYQKYYPKLGKQLVVGDVFLVFKFGTYEKILSLLKST